MYIDNRWIPIDREILSKLAARVDPVGEKHLVDPETTKADWRGLPFYDSVALIRLKDPAWVPANLYIYFLRLDGDLYWLNGTSPPLHEVNAKAPVRITEANVIDYLEFFCFFVHGEEGPFLIAQSIQDPYVPKNIDEKTRVALENTLRPAYMAGVDERGSYLCDAAVLYSNAVFDAQFKVQPTGMIEMQSDEPILTNLAIKVWAPLS